MTDATNPAGAVDVNSPEFRAAVAAAVRAALPAPVNPITDIASGKLVRPPSAGRGPVVPETPAVGPVRAAIDRAGAPPDPKALTAAAAPGTDIVRFEGEIWCPARDRESSPDCQEHFPVKFDTKTGVYRGFCPKHTDIAVCEGGVLDSLKVQQ